LNHDLVYYLALLDAYFIINVAMGAENKLRSLINHVLEPIWLVNEELGNQQICNLQ
jgi:hypothetical protein